MFEELAKDNLERRQVARLIAMMITTWPKLSLTQLIAAEASDLRDAFIE